MAIYRTSTAWRPLYQPQFEQTVWGTLACRHCGHTLRAGTVIVQALARLVRDLDLEVFFLGTATSWRSYTLDQPWRPPLPPPVDTISQPD
jgi:hypothetical protein